MHYPTNDIRRQTHDTRVAIGFQTEYTKWQDEPATFTDHTLTINGHPVMEDWEDSYMKALADIATSQGGRVLEVGYGMGISARYIQTKQVTEHLIIEANRDVYTKLVEFSEVSTQLVTPLLGFWQEVIPTIATDSIDGILFDTYPLTQAEIHCNHFDFFAAAYRILKPGGVLTYYSDEVADFSPEHLEKLRAAGFTKIDKKICMIDTPANCLYWQADTMVAPIITK